MGSDLIWNSRYGMIYLVAFIFWRNRFVPICVDYSVSPPFVAFLFGGFGSFRKKVFWVLLIVHVAQFHCGHGWTNGPVGP